jgi:hypothetical protein
VEDRATLESDPSAREWLYGRAVGDPAIVGIVAALFFFFCALPIALLIVA